MTFAIIGGSGDLPKMLLAATSGILVRFKGIECSADADHVIDAEFERLGTLFSDLHSAGVTKLIFAGAMQRPNLDPARMDPKTMALAPRIMTALAQGDDALLREVLAIFSDVGFEMVAAHEVLPDLLVNAGNMAGEPTAAQISDGIRGEGILAALGPLDVSQVCAVTRGQCIGIETLQGTDKMLEFICNSRDLLPDGGVLVKRAKIGQDLRIDMPTIGPDTVFGVALAGLTGICIQAGSVMVLDREAVVSAAKEQGVTIWATL